MAPEPYLRSPPSRKSRRSVRSGRRRWRWLAPVLLAVGLAVAAVAGLPRLGSGLVPTPPAALPSGWEHLGFRGREILLLAAHWREPVVYCLTDGGLARSADAGRSWEESALPPGAGPPTAMAVGVNDPLLALLGTGAGQVYRSEDGGRSWKLVHAGEAAVVAVMFDLHHPRVALCIRSGREAGGLWRSADYGQSWNRLAPGPLTAAAFHPQEGGVLYAAGPARVSRTTDGGKTWTHLEVAGVRALATAPEDPAALYLVLGDRLLYLKAWGARSEPAPLPEGTVQVLVHPEDPSLLYAGTAPAAGGGVWRSADRGRSWTLYSEGLGTPRVTRFSLGLAGHTLYVGTVGDGLWRYSPAGPAGGTLP